MHKTNDSGLPILLIISLVRHGSFCIFGVFLQKYATKSNEIHGNVRIRKVHEPLLSTSFLVFIMIVISSLTWIASAHTL